MQVECEGGDYVAAVFKGQLYIGDYVAIAYEGQWYIRIMQEYRMHVCMHACVHVYIYTRYGYISRHAHINYACRNCAPC